MGCCCSSDAKKYEQQNAAERQKDQEIQRVMMYASDQDSKVSKLLLLGAGQSGKTTILKQMLQIFGEGFNDQSRKPFASVVRRNALNSIQAMCKALDTLPEAFREEEWTLDEAELAAKKHVLGLTEHDADTENTDLKCMKLMWASKSIQQAYMHRSEYQLDDSAKYFLDQLDTIWSSRYLPSIQDVMHARIKTIGIKEHDFDVGGQIFKFVDVGGQRSERRKWMHCFDAVTCVLYVCAYSAYDQVLFEDHKVNRIDESLHLYENLINSKWFKSTRVILFLNKDDVFKEKINRVPLSTWAPDFDEWKPSQPLSVGSTDPNYKYEKGKQYIKSRFVRLNRVPSREIVCHFTTAINRDNIEYVFQSVKDIILKVNLEQLDV